jgi:hypothetical protein
MRLNSTHIWWLRLRLVFVALLVVVAILTLSYDRAEGSTSPAGSIVMKSCAADDAQPTVPRTATILFCTGLLLAAGLNRRLS